MKKLRLLPALVFVVFIFGLCAFFFITPKKEYSSSEKRYLQQAPAFSFQSLFSGDFGEDFETFLSDQFAGRNLWVGLNAYYNLALGNNGEKGIYFCKDGYLVNDPTDGDRLSSNLQIIEEFCKKHEDIPSTMLLAPSTGYTCSDILPTVHRDYKDDELFSEMKKTLQTPVIVDVRQPLKYAYAKHNQVFYKTDHHWTCYGAFTAYQSLGDALGYTPNETDNYEIESHGGFYGTTYSSSGFWLTKPDTIELWKSKKIKKAHVKIEDSGKLIEQDGMFFLSHLEEDDQYPVFLDGNHPLTTITNENAEKDEKLLIIKDSFAHSLAPFLVDHFKQITMLDMRYFKQNVSEFLEKEKFDRILVLYSVDNLATDGDIAWLE